MEHIGLQQAKVQILLLIHDNGLNWTGLGTSNMTAPAKVSYNGNKLVIVGFGPTHPIIYSDNGTTWNNANNSSIVFTIGGNDKTLGMIQDRCSWLK